MIFFKILVVSPCVRKIPLKTTKFSSKKAKKIFKLFMKFAENCQILTKISFNLTQKLNNILSYITKIMPKISAVEESHKTNFFLLEPSTLLKMTNHAYTCHSEPWVKASVSKNLRKSACLLFSFASHSQHTKTKHCFIIKFINILLNIYNI